MSVRFRYPALTINIKNMKYIKEYLEQKIKIEPLGKLTTTVYEAMPGEYIGEEILIDSRHTGIVIYYIDYINWIENEFLVR